MIRFPLCLAVLVLPFAVGADEPAKLTTIRVVTPDGKPAVGAKVWVYLDSHDKDRKLPEPSPKVTDAEGKVASQLPAETDRSVADIFVRGADGHIGGSQVFASRLSSEGESGPLPIKLVDVADRSGRVTDPAGKPIAGATVTPPASTWVVESDGRQSLSVGFPPWEQTGVRPVKKSEK